MKEEEADPPSFSSATWAHSYPLSKPSSSFPSAALAAAAGTDESVDVAELHSEPLQLIKPAVSSNPLTPVTYPVGSVQRLLDLIVLGSSSPLRVLLELAEEPVDA